MRVTLYGHATQRVLEGRGKFLYRSLASLRDFIQTTSSVRVQTSLPSRETFVTQERTVEVVVEPEEEKGEAPPN